MKYHYNSKSHAGHDLDHEQFSLNPVSSPLGCPASPRTDADRLYDSAGFWAVCLGSGCGASWLRHGCLSAASSSLSSVHHVQRQRWSGSRGASVQVTLGRPCPMKHSVNHMLQIFLLGSGSQFFSATRITAPRPESDPTQLLFRSC